MKRLIPILAVLALLGLICGAMPARRASGEDRLPDLLKLLAQMGSSYAQVDDYTALFHKQERIKDKLLPEETIILKFQKPLKVYMRWTGGSHEGQEALYVEGENDNKLVAHQGGLWGFVTLSLDPEGPRAMKGHRHPITEAGFGHLLEGLGRDIRAAAEHGELDIIRLDEGPFYGRPSIVFEVRATPRGGRRYYAARMVCHIDKGLMLPVGAAFYDQKDLLFEKYEYSDVKLNVGLTPMDFSRYNPAYRF